MKIAAVIVTYNRLELLKECINAVRNQTRTLDEIIVINNSSTDGTLEWLNKQDDLTVITQENLGGAGGFYTGIKTAYEKGYDWIWCMDDDGLPTPNCLSILMNNIDDADVIGPIVYEKEKDELAFNVYYLYNKNKYHVINNIQLLDGIKSSTSCLNGWASFFNGILLPNYLINKIGLPKREMFMWGDEVEYYKRILFSKFKVKLCLNAIYYHPKDRLPNALNEINRKLLNIKHDYKIYCYFRNLGYIEHTYSKFKGIRILFKYLLETIRSGIPQNFIFIFNAYMSGYFNKF